MEAIANKQILTKLKKNFGSAIIFMSLILSSFGYFFNCPMISLLAVLMLAGNNLIYSFLDLKRNIVFAIFHVCFFIFLLGRFVVSGIFSYDGAYHGLFEMSFPSRVVLKMLLYLYISLLAIFVAYFRQQFFYLSDTELSPTLKQSYGLLGYKLPLHDKTIATKSMISLFLKKSFASSRKTLLSFERKFWSLFFKKSDDEELEAVIDRQNFKKLCKKIALAFFYFTSTFEIIYVVNLISFTRKVGYNISYLLPNQWAGSIIFLLGSMYDISLFTYISLEKRAKKSISPIILYLLIGVLYLLAGRRKEFMLNFLIIITYIVLQVKDNKLLWKRIILPMLLLVPILIIALELVGKARQGSAAGASSIVVIILSFFYNQGVSARVIGHSIVHRNRIPRFKFYSIGTIIEFIRYKLIGNYILGNPVPSGQSIERATEGHLFSQAIAWLSNSEDYLKGVGTGSSYVAELYVDFHIFGIIIGSLIYGKLMIYFTKQLQSKKFVVCIFTYLMVRGFYFTPRSGFVSFITTAFSPRQILGLLIILLITYALNVFLNLKKLKAFEPRK